ncbi:MAG: c-type cytochrome [Halobacteriovoraceae bacterium]|nr:c-type cytochrome [Halobacteriovoraceae bacterium]
MKGIVSTLLLLSTLLSLVSCQDERAQFYESKIFAGGVVASADDLNKGRRIYQEYCMACHGVKGDGQGVASKGLVPPPRNFTLGLFKFGKVPSGELPHDSHLKNIILNGLNGTGMLPWDLKEKQLFQVVQYIKTFAPKAWEGKDKKLGKEIEVTKDPYGMAHKKSAIERGKFVYHMQAQCQACHRGYATKQEMDTWSMKTDGSNFEMDKEFYKIKLQDSEHGYQAIPVDFTWHFVRSAKTVEDLYVRIASGVGGTSMPAWIDTLSTDDIWAVAHYVKSLIDIKNTPQRKKLIDSLK